LKLSVVERGRERWKQREKLGTQKPAQQY
jgi:hypothetical protein